MEMNLFLKGCLIGLSTALFVGPITLLCIRYSLIRGAGYGFAAGMGATIADLLYGLMAGFGMTILCEFLSRHQVTCQLFGALFFCLIGIKTLLSKPEKKESNQIVAPLSYKRVFLITFLLTLTNPLTILGFMATYAVLGIAFTNQWISPLLFLSGILLGSLVWWLILSLASSLIGRKINIKSTSYINKISGSAFLVLGLLTGFAALTHQSLF